MPELAELIRQRNFNGLKEILCDFPAPDIAEIFFDLKPDDEAVLLRLLPRELAAEVFEYLPLEDQEKLLHALGSEQVAQILNDIAPDDRTALLQELPAAATQKLLALLNPEERKIATELLGYPKNSIGRRMTPRIRRHPAELDGRRSVRAIAQAEPQARRDEPALRHGQQGPARGFRAPARHRGRRRRRLPFWNCWRTSRFFCAPPTIRKPPWPRSRNTT